MALWLVGAVTASSREPIADIVCHPAYGGCAPSKYRFESVDGDFAGKVSRLLEDVSYTLVFDSATRSAQLFLHGSGSGAAVAYAPQVLLGQLAENAEQGGNVDFPLAASLMDSDESEIRSRLAEILGEVGGTAATMVLAELLLDSDESVALAAADALVEQNTEEAVRVLGSALLDGKTPQRYEAAEALTEFETELARTYLVQARGDPDQRVRELVAETLTGAD